MYALKSRGYTVASVEHEAQSRLATIRLRSPQGVKIDLLFASSGMPPNYLNFIETLHEAQDQSRPLVGWQRESRKIKRLA